jgi:Domain of unknown function (DUF222)
MAMTDARKKAVADRLRAIGKSLARLTAEQLVLLAEIARSDAEDGVSERKTATNVANMTSSTAKQAAADLALAKQVAALPGVADAHRRGEISNGQLGAVASIAQAGSEQEALDMANTATSAQLQRRAVACRGQLTEKRLAAQKGRYLAFKPEEDGQSTRLHGRLPFAEARQLESQLRKIADRLGLGNKERPSPSARMADALLILTKGNASVALHEYEKSSAPNNGSSSTKRASTDQPFEGDGLANGKADTGATIFRGYPRSSETVIDYDVDPFPDSDSPDTSSEFDDTPDDPENLSQSGREASNVVAFADAVQRADTRLIIHWNAADGSINFEDGPPVDHPRLQAILCDAQIDIQHCDENGLPTGLITTQHHASWRQERYLAFRDGVCRMPECQGIGKTHSHHMFEDRADRVTDVRSMISLCYRDHQQHHDGIFTITGDPEGTIQFNYRDGTVLSSTARPTPIGIRPPKPQPFSKHQTDTQDIIEFPLSA